MLRQQCRICQTSAETYAMGRSVDLGEPDRGERDVGLGT